MRTVIVDLGIIIIYARYVRLRILLGQSFPVSDLLTKFEYVIEIKVILNGPSFFVL